MNQKKILVYNYETKFQSLKSLVQDKITMTVKVANAFYQRKKNKEKKHLFVVWKRNMMTKMTSSEYSNSLVDWL